MTYAAGATNANPPSAGGANTGNGGQGASTSTQAGGAGGSGIVILAYPDTYPDLTSIGGSLVKTGGGTTPTSTSGGKKRYVFTGGTGTVTV